MPVARRALPDARATSGAWRRSCAASSTASAPVIDRAPQAFPAVRRLFRDDFPPLLRSVDPFLRQLNPILDAIGSYKHEVSALVANAAATTNGVSLVKGETGPLPADAQPAEPGVGRDLSEAAADQPQHRLLEARRSTRKPRQGPAELRRPPVHGAASPPSSTRRRPTDPAFTARTDGDVADAQDFFDRLQLFAFGDQLSTERRARTRELRQAGAVRTVRRHGHEDRLPAHPPRAVGCQSGQIGVRGAARRAAPSWVVAEELPIAGVGGQQLSVAGTTS